jgi:hypothetical protein
MKIPKPYEGHICHPLKIVVKGLPDAVSDIMHYWPHAYCVGKPNLACALFVMPPQINRNTETCYEQATAVGNNSAEQCNVGGWYSLAYCVFPGRGSWVVVVPYQPNPPVLPEPKKKKKK